MVISSRNLQFGLGVQTQGVAPAKIVMIALKRIQEATRVIVLTLVMTLAATPMAGIIQVPMVAMIQVLAVAAMIGPLGLRVILPMKALVRKQGLLERHQRA